MHRFQELALTQPTYSEERIKKHLNLLDGIALLLVTESQSDVVATAFTQTPNSIKVDFARNSAVKISTNYVNQILNQLALLKLSDDRNLEATKLVLIVLKPCFPKIKQRTRKLWNVCKKILPDKVTKISTSLSRGCLNIVKEFRAQRLYQRFLNSYYLSRKILEP